MFRVYVSLYIRPKHGGVAVIFLHIKQQYYDIKNSLSLYTKIIVLASPRGWLACLLPPPVAMTGSNAAECVRIAAGPRRRNARPASTETKTKTENKNTKKTTIANRARLSVQKRLLPLLKRALLISYSYRKCNTLVG